MALARDAVPAVDAKNGVGIIDADVHPYCLVSDKTFAHFIPQRWHDYMNLVGQRYGGVDEMTIPREREFGHRTDALPPGGGPPGSDPSFARSQLLDQYGMSGAILNDLRLALYSGAGGRPLEFAQAMIQAMNDWRREVWIAQDPRWYSSINVP